MRKTVQQWRPVPAAQVRAAADGASDAWIAEGDDPQFHIQLDEPLEAGWYRVTGPLGTEPGQVLDPCLYPDYGQGMSEASTIPLHCTPGAALLDCVIPLAGNVHFIRLDPLKAPGQFRLGCLTARSLTPREALWRMLHQMLQPLRRRKPAEALRLADEFRRLRVAEGTERALEWLWACYSEASGFYDEAYLAWVVRHEAPVQPQAQSRTDSDGAAAPLFSLVLAESAAPGTWFDAIRAQRCGRWELLVPSVPETHGDMRGDDRVVALPLDGRVFDRGAWLREAVMNARGRYVMFLGPGDVPHPQALELLARAHERLSAQLVYGDDDVLDDQGARHSPYFKPQWDPDLQIAQHYVGAAFSVETRAAREVMSEPLEDGAELYDLILRCSAVLPGKAIAHVPAIVLHHQEMPGPGGEPGVLVRQGITRPDAMQRAASRHLALVCAGAQAKMPGPEGLRVVWPAPAEPVAVDIVIPTRDRIDLLSKCVDSLLARTKGQDFRITIVDNGSEEPVSHAYFAQIGADARVRVFQYPHPFNYSAINNFAVERCTGDVIVLMNNDIEVISEDWLVEMVSQAMRPGVGAVGAKLLYPDDTVQHAGVVLGVKGVAAHAYMRRRRDFPGYFGRALVAHEMSAVTAACLAVRRSVFQEVGGLDESLAVAFNDVDFCLRVHRAGYRNIWTPHAVLYHHESASRGYEDNPEKQRRFASEVEAMRSRWGKKLDSDPAYSPNLSLAGNPFDIDPMRGSEGLGRYAMHASHGDSI